VGEILTLMRRGKEAAPLHVEVLAIRRGVEPIDHQAVARTLRQLALSRYMQGEFDPTITLLGEARAELDKVPNPDAELRSDILKYTANLFHEKGDFEHAIPAYREALAQYRAALGENHPSVASTLGDLAIALKDTQQFDEAEKAYLDSLAIYRLILSPNHPDVGNALNNLAVLYAERGQHDKALESAQEGTRILRAALGDDHDMTNIARLNAARAHTQLGHLSEAEQEFRAILAIRRRTLNPENLSLPLTMDALADVLNREKKYVEASGYAREARAGMEKAVGREHWRWANVSRTLGVSLTGQEKYAEAETILLESYDVALRKRGPTNRTTLLTAQRLSELYQAWNRPADAQAWLAKGQAPVR
jgi:tetratricopeptide (TPR) repeat protein